MKIINWSIFSRHNPFLAICLGASFVILGVAQPALANNIYVAQNAVGGDTGADAADAHSVGWLNTTANWWGNTIGPGSTIHLVGTITNAIQAQSGGSRGNPITIYFEPGAKMSSPTWNSVPIFGQTYSDIVVDGGSNGLIEATANGSGLAYQVNPSGVYFNGGSRITVKNLLIQNLFVRTPGSSDSTSNPGNGVLFGGNNMGTNCVTNCVFHDMFVGVNICYGSNCANFQVLGCTAYNVNWGGCAGDTGPASMLNGLLVSNTTVYNWQDWNSPSDQYHHNGFYSWAESGGILSNVTYSANTIGPGYGGVNQTAGLYVSGHAFNVLICNNFLNATDGTAPADGFINVGFNTWGPPQTPQIARVYNNTIMGGGNGMGVSFYNGYGPSLTIYDCKNNLFDNIQTAIAQWYCPNLQLLANYDLAYNVPTGSAFVWATAGSSWFCPIAQWQAAGWDTHLQTSNPNLTQNFIPQAPSAAITNAVDLSAYFTTDFNGNTRPPGQWDIGAFQHSGLYAPSNLHFLTQ
jgi:hypothetical protein